jgi:hypothetical protein
MVVVRDYYRQGAKFTLKLSGPSNNFYACQQDSDCVKVNAGCCPHEGKVAVRKGQEAAYQAALMCQVPTVCIAIAPPPDTKTAICNANNKCEAVETEGMSCGGHAINPRQCPAGYQCLGHQMAWDAPGKCYKLCGGIASLPCSDGTLNTCVDSPNDGCDPNAGGADCGGICHQCGNVAAKCQPGYHFDWLDCNCVQDPTPPADCRTTGCGVGRYCTYCWTGFACIPNGAVC